MLEGRSIASRRKVFQPDLNRLTDRMLVAAESAGIRPVISINKLSEYAELVPLAGVYACMGYPVVLCSSQQAADCPG